MKRIKPNQTLKEAIQSDIDAVLHEMRHSLAAMPDSADIMHESVIHIDVDAVLSSAPAEVKPQMSQIQKTHDNAPSRPQSREVRFHTEGDFLMNSSAPRTVLPALIRAFFQPFFMLLKRFEY